MLESVALQLASVTIALVTGFEELLEVVVEVELFHRIRWRFRAPVLRRSPTHVGRAPRAVCPVGLFIIDENGMRRRVGSRVSVLHSICESVLR